MRLVGSQQQHSEELWTEKHGSRECLRFYFCFAVENEVKRPIAVVHEAGDGSWQVFAKDKSFRLAW